MMAMIMFALIGAQINANAWYWICFGLFCAITVIKAVIETIKEKL